MWRELITIITIAGASSSVAAQTVTDPAEIASRLKFWTQETGDPVYYGEVRNVDARTKQIGGHYQCLALAFIKYDGGDCNMPTRCGLSRRTGPAIMTM